MKARVLSHVLQVNLCNMDRIIDGINEAVTSMRRILLIAVRVKASMIYETGSVEGVPCYLFTNRTMLNSISVRYIGEREPSINHNIEERYRQISNLKLIWMGTVWTSHVQSPQRGLNHTLLSLPVGQRSAYVMHSEKALVEDLQSRSL